MSLPNCIENNDAGQALEAYEDPPTPRINLHDLEAIRMEMGRVYRDMRLGNIASQDGSRFIFVLGELRKIFQACDLERRLQELETNK